MTNSELPTTTAEETPAQLTTAEIRVEKRPSPAPEGDDEPQTIKKQKTEEEVVDEQMKDVKEETVPIVPTPQKETTAAAAEATAPAAPSNTLLVKKLSSKGRVPTRGSALSAGYDMYSAHETTIPARGKALVDTDISIAVPVGTYGRIAPRSGLASKNFIDVGAGVIDADYRGQVKILLFNHSDVDFQVKEGDRVAQLVLERIFTPEVLEVEDLEESARGAGGFGSTGI